MNIPYVKHRNDLGEVINPIQGVYASEFPNRRQRRYTRQRSWGKKPTEPAFGGQGKEGSIVAAGVYKYRLRRQAVYDKKLQGQKFIEHYDLKGVNY